MLYVKLAIFYHLDHKVAELDDASEVMWTRGLSHCGSGTGGFISPSVLGTLTRKPAQASKIARRLVAAGLWDVDGKGYRIRNWDIWQEALDSLEQRRQSDRDRKRAQRARLAKTPTSHVTVPGPSRDRSRHVTGGEVEEEVNAAAAAPDAAAAAPSGLHPAVEILRSKMQSHTALRALRFDTLRADQQTELVALIDLHGDARLVKVALQTLRPEPVIFVTAFIGTWRALPPPGKRVHAVPDLPPAVEGPAQTAEGVAAAREVFNQARNGGAS